MLLCDYFIFAKILCFKFVIVLKICDTMIYCLDCPNNNHILVIIFLKAYYANNVFFSLLGLIILNTDMPFKNLS